MAKKTEKEMEPTIAPGLEMDELEASATAAEEERGDVTPVTKLVIDRVPEDPDFEEQE